MISRYNIEDLFQWKKKKKKKHLPRKSRISWVPQLGTVVIIASFKLKLHSRLGFAVKNASPFFSLLRCFFAALFLSFWDENAYFRLSLDVYLQKTILAWNESLTFSTCIHSHSGCGVLWNNEFFVCTRERTETGVREKSRELITRLIFFAEACAQVSPSRQWA